MPGGLQFARTPGGVEFVEFGEVSGAGTRSIPQFQHHQGSAPGPSSVGFRTWRDLGRLAARERLGCVAGKEGKPLSLRAEDAAICSFISIPRKRPSGDTNFHLNGLLNDVTDSCGAREYLRRRRSISQPRVARNELPWVVDKSAANSEGVEEVGVLMGALRQRGFLQPTSGLDAR